MAPMESAVAEFRATNGKSCVNPLCRSKGKSKRVFTLGVCKACDQAQRRAIAAGETTRERLIEEGKCLPKGKQIQRRRPRRV